MNTPLTGAGSGLIPGVLGTGTGGGNGIVGASDTGNGVVGMVSISGDGVRGSSSGGYGVYGDNIGGTGAGVHGETRVQANYGVSGVNNNSWPCVAILGSSSSGHGAKGVNGSGSGKSPTRGAGVWGDSQDGYGVYGASKTSDAGHFDGGVSVNGQITASSGTVNGDLHVSGHIETGGNITLTGSGDLILSGADCAEQFDVAGATALEPGSVLVIDNNGALELCRSEYDRRVAGVVSGAGSFRSGIVLDRHPGQDGRAAVALVGKVYCKVDADAGSISVGDLLTTSLTPGHAMKASDRVQAFGAVIGKALQPLESGKGMIPILVALQ